MGFGDGLGFGVGGLRLFEVGFGLFGSEVEGFLLKGAVAVVAAEVEEGFQWDLLRWEEGGGGLDGLFEGGFGGFPPAMLMGESYKMLARS